MSVICYLVALSVGIYKSIFMYKYVCIMFIESASVIERESVKVLVAESCSTLCNSMDCSPPGSSVHGIFQARILEWDAIAFSH